jgi:hypothetical protein
MMYHVGRNSQPLGEFTETQIREKLDQGEFLVTDLVWQQGMPQWQRLDQVFGFAAAHSLSAPLNAQGSGASFPIGFTPAQAFSSMPSGVGVMPIPATAIISLVLGVISIASLVLCMLGAILAVPGIICGHMALSEIKRSNNLMQGKGLAIAGLVTNYLAVGFLVLLVLFFGFVFGIAAASSK